MVSDAVAAPLPEPSASVDTRGLVASDERFVAAVRGQLSDATLDLRNEEITEMGGQACAALAAGQPRGEVAEELAGYGLPKAAAREMVILARTTLCEPGDGTGGGEPSGNITGQGAGPGGGDGTTGGGPSGSGSAGRNATRSAGGESRTGDEGRLAGGED